MYGANTGEKVQQSVNRETTGCKKKEKGITFSVEVEVSIGSVQGILKS
jgi:hypothetical protein